MLNMKVLVIALELHASCEFLGLKESFQGIFFGHVFSQACQYGTIE
jgi:hypothetical protein